MRALILFLLIIGLFYKLDAQNVGQEGNDSLLNYKDINGLKQGKWIKKYVNGQVRYKGYFVDDKPQGVFKQYDRSGNLKARQYYYGDSLQCSTVLFYPQGDTLAYGRHFNKMKDSIWNYYNEKGQLMMTESYRKGVYHGDFIYYHQNGSKWQYIHYENGKKDGHWKRFYRNGNPMFETFYEDGMRQDTFKTYYPDGQLEVVVPYVNDLKHGKFILYDRHGNVIETREYNKGVPENQEELERRETQRIDSLLQNRGRYDEPYDQGVNFFKKDRY